MPIRKGQYKRKISQWNLDKNVKDAEMLFIVHKQKKRKLEGKDTKFRIRDRPVEPEKISRAIKRKGIPEDDLPSQPATPSGIIYGTPSEGGPPTPGALDSVLSVIQSPAAFPNSPHTACSPPDPLAGQNPTQLLNSAASPTPYFSTFTGRSPAPFPNQPASPAPPSSYFSMIAGQSPDHFPTSPSNFQPTDSLWSMTGDVAREPLGMGTLELFLTIGEPYIYQHYPSVTPTLDHPMLEDSISILTQAHVHVNHEGLEDRSQPGPEWPNNFLNCDHSVPLQTTGDRMTSSRRGDQPEEKGEQYHRRALIDKEKALGFGHPETLASVDELARVLENQGKYKTAEEMHRRALAGREKVLGKGHPDGLQSMNSLGWVLERQGRFKAAEEMHQRALVGREKVLGKEHPDTLESVDDLGWVLMRQGRYKEAEEMQRRALVGREKVLGKEHPDTLESVDNLGRVLQRQGRYQAAEAMHRRSLVGKEKTLGKEHSRATVSASYLALTLKHQDKYEEAEKMQRRTLVDFENVLGKEHPDTLLSVSYLALILSRQGKYEEAEKMERRAIVGLEKVLGQEHPSTLASVSNLTLILEHQEKC